MAVLPGSRKNEVCKLLPVFLEAAEKIHQEHPEYYFVMPTVKTVAETVKKAVAESRLPLIVTETETDRYNAFKASAAAIAASGTVALELAILDVPHLIGYKVSALSAWLAKRFLKIEFVNLSNILLRHGDLYERQMEGFKKVREVLGFGRQTPSENAARIILETAEKN